MLSNAAAQCRQKEVKLLYRKVVITQLLLHDIGRAQRKTCNTMAVRLELLMPRTYSSVHLSGLPALLRLHNARIGSREGTVELGASEDSF